MELLTLHLNTRHGLYRYKVSCTIMENASVNCAHLNKEWDDIVRDT